MKYSIVILLLVGLAFSCSNKSSSTNLELKTFEDSVAYAIGLNVGENLKKDEVDLNLDLIREGMSDAMNEGETKIAKEEIMKIFQKYQMQIQALAAKKAQEQSKVNREEGEKFLAENAKKDGVITTESGLQYMVMKEGTGAKPTATSTVKVNYHGTRVDGVVFDSSVERGEPIEFPLNGVISGWTEGVQLMSIGSKYKFFIPADLAYGDRAMGAKIPAGSTLIFEIELLEIK